MTKPAYVLVRTDDLRLGPEISEYVRSVDATLEQHGAEILVQNLPALVMAGDWTGFVTLLRFESLAAANRWFDSPEYQALAPLRRGSSTPTELIVEGVAPGHRSSDLAEIFGL